MRSIFLWFCLAAGLYGACAQPKQAAQPFEVIGYYAGDGNNLAQYNFSQLTQVIFSFLHLKGDSLAFDNENSKAALSKLVALKAAHPQLKVLVSLGGWTGCYTCSDVFATEKGRDHFAKSVAQILQQNGADGIDLDWEYPAIQGPPDHPFRAEDRQNFTDLIVKLRKAIGPDAELSFAAGGFTEFLEKSVEWNKVMPLVNRVNLMTYDLINGYSTETGHHTALMSTPLQKESTDHCVQWLLQKGVDPRKLIIGAAFYARIWKDVSNKNWGLYQKGVFKQGLNFKDFEQLEPDSGWAHQWDLKAKAPYAFHKTKFLFATYDNAMSLYEKVLYARKYNLGGIMFWELQCDTPKDGLLQAITDAVVNTNELP